MQLDLNDAQIQNLTRIGLDQVLAQLQHPQRAPSGRPEVAQYWEGQGGVVAGDSRDRDGRVFTLIWVCDRDLKPILTDELEYGCRGTEVEGASNYSDGLANAKALLEAGSPLAMAIVGKTFVGNSDCYPPSIGELTIIRANLSDLVPTDQAFWSSTQFDDYYAWGQYFYYGYVTNWDKSCKFRAFPVRRVYR